MRIDDMLKDVKALYIDTSPFIYYTENRIDFLAQVKKVFAYAELHKISMITSVITVSECLTKPLREKDTNLIGLYENLFEETTDIDLIGVSFIIARKSADLRAKYGLRTPDALHIATALITGCEAFLTNDIALKRVTELRVLVLSEISL